MTSRAPASQQEQQQQPDRRGIDPSEALSILSSRAGGDAHLRPSSISNEKRSMGQILDVMEWTRMMPSCDDGCTSKTGSNKSEVGRSSDVTSNSFLPPQNPSLSKEETKQKENEEDLKQKEEKEQKQKEEEQKQQRLLNIRKKLETMAVPDLFKALFEAQRERTVTYTEFDRGLEVVLDSQNISSYPDACAKATASFAVLSDTINTIRSILVDKHKRKDVSKLIRTLQRHEKEKLNFTAALHLERLRQQNHDLVENDNDDGSKTMTLLREGVADLKMKLRDCVECINDVLEELRYAAAEED